MKPFATCRQLFRAIACLSFPLFFVETKAGAQDGRDTVVLLTLRLGLSTFMEPTIYVHPVRLKGAQLTFGLGYKAGSAGSKTPYALQPNATKFRRMLAKEGLVFKAGVFFPDKKVDRTILFVVKRTGANNFLEYGDPNMGGTSSEYNFRSNIAGLQYFVDYRTQRASFYLSFGAGFNTEKRKYLSGAPPDSMGENLDYFPWLAFDCGLRLPLKFLMKEK